MKKNWCIILALLIYSLPGRTFTPHSFNGVVSRVSSQDLFLERVMKALNNVDYEEIEVLRGQLKPEHLPAIVNTWNEALEWKIKDAFVTLLSDQTDEIVHPVMKDGLNSPTAETRAYSICVLKNDFSLFENFLDENGMVNPKKVDEQIKQFKLGK